MAATAPSDFRLLEQLRQRAPRLDAKRCQQIRLRADVSLRQIATEVGVTVSTVWRWEQGVQHPRGATGERYFALLAALEALPSSLRPRTPRKLRPRGRSAA